MKYRAIYQDKINNPGIQEVVSVYENDSNVITTTGQNFMVDELEVLIDKLSYLGVDISFFWKNNISSRKTPSNLSVEIDITNHPNDPLTRRKVFVDKLSIDQTKKILFLICIVRHFDSDGNHDIVNYDDEFVALPADNNTIVNYMGEFDYFVDLINNQGANIFDIQIQNITSLDSQGRFNNIYS